MSAFVVGKAHIDALVSLLTEGPAESRGPWDGTGWVNAAGAYEAFTTVSADRVGQMLWDQNHRSVNARYGERTRTPRYRYARPHRRPTAVEGIKLLDCLEYQSCESSDWESTEAYRARVALALALGSHLAGWEAAPWEWRTEHASGAG